MKDFFVRWTTRGRIVTFVVVVVALAGGSGSAWAGKTAQVTVGFTGSIVSNIVSPSTFQNVLLNVQAVRINPHANAGPGSGGWQTIPTPPGIGGGSQSAELQIDLNTSQDVPQLFNTSKVRPATYKVVQILLDPNRPGSLIPNCPQSGSLEGCISYPIVLTNGQLITAPISVVAPGNGTTTQLVFQLQLMVNQAPTVAGGTYQATLTVNPLTNALGTVTGSITHSGTSSGSTGKLIKLAVTAETVGTNTPIASALVKNNQYSLTLPAASGFGTLYDLAVAGGGDSYSAARLPPVFPGTTINGPSFAVKGQMVGNITGSVMDGCVAGTPIVGATLQLLVPPVSDSGLDCTMTPDQCVTVASATTDNAGDFPLPGSLTTPPQFQNVPAPPSSNPNGAYAMEVTAPGYDPLIVQVKPSTATTGKNSGGVCAPVGSSTFTKCDLLMTTAFITGSIPITAPLPGQTTLVQVFAEPTGSNNIVSALPMPISVRNPNGTVKFTIRVPSTPLIPSFDLFATTIDQYQGVSDPYQGHNIVVFSGAPQPGRCNTSPSVDFAQTINCVGHGSIVGTVNQANLGASIALSKLSSPDAMSGAPVQITTAQIQNQTSGGSNYAFCVPGDTYQLQALQLPEPVAGVAPSVAPTPVLTGDPTVVTVMTPNPSATPTPKLTCPTTCSNPDGSCPGICNTTNAALTIPTLPPTPSPPTATPTATATP